MNFAFLRNVAGIIFFMPLALCFLLPVLVQGAIQGNPSKNPKDTQKPNTQWARFAVWRFLGP